MKVCKIRKNLYTCKMGKRESIRSYEARIQTHLQSLKNLGRAVPDNEAVRIVIVNIPDKHWVHVWRRDTTDVQNGQQRTTEGFLFGQSLRYVFEELKLVELAYQAQDVYRIVTGSELKDSDDSDSKSERSKRSNDEIVGNSDKRNKEEVDSETSRSVKRHESASKTSGMLLSD